MAASRPQEGPGIRDPARRVSGRRTRSPESAAGRDRAGRQGGEATLGPAGVWQEKRRTEGKNELPNARGRRIAGGRTGLWMPTEQYGRGRLSGAYCSGAESGWGPDWEGSIRGLEHREAGSTAAHHGG